MKEVDNELTDNLVEFLLENDPNDKGFTEEVESKFNCTVSVTDEKHNVLQYTHYYYVDFGLDQNFYVEIESGIRNQ